MTKTDDVGKRTYYTGSSSIENGDSVKYFHYNHRGDTVLVTDSEGNVLNNFSYEAYGRPTNSEGIPVNNLSIKNIPNLFVGSSGIRYDFKTDLHYMRFRWFSPSQLRFISPDLLMDLNRYAYVSGNPVNNIDPSGLSDEFIASYVNWSTNFQKNIENFVGRAVNNSLNNLANFYSQLSDGDKCLASYVNWSMNLQKNLEGAIKSGLDKATDFYSHNTTGIDLSFNAGIVYAVGAMPLN